MTLRRPGHVAIGKLAVGLVALVTVALAVMVVASALRLVPMGRFTAGGVLVTVGVADLPLQNRIMWLAGGLGGIAMSSVLLRAAFRSLDERGFVLSTGGAAGMVGGGTVIVSAKSLHALATYTAERVDGVLEAASRVRQSREGWKVDIWLMLSPRVELRQAAHEAKVAVEEVLLHHTGMTVGDMRIWAQLDPLGKKRLVA